MAIDRKALFAKLDGGKSKAPASDIPVEGSEDEMSPGEMLLKAIDAKDPEAIEEAVKA